MRIGFVGIGAMGFGMAGTLAEAGHEVAVFDLDRAVLDRFVARYPARAAGGMGEIAGNEVVICMLPDGHVVRRTLMEAEDGAFLAAAGPGVVVIDMSSSDPVGTRELGKALKARGIALVDSPISKRDVVFGPKGGRLESDSKALPLVLMVGCDDRAVLDKVRPVLSLLGDTIFETGALGSGHASKALNNYSSAAAQCVLAEALLVGARFGLDPRTLVDIFNVSTGRSFNSDAVYSQIVRDPGYTAGFALGLMAKDVGIAAGLARSVGVEAPVVDLIEQRWALARERLGFGADVAQAMQAWQGDGERA